MSDSHGNRSDKRERLIHSAQLLVHRQGVQKTTLAQVAANAQVPVGNVYYYFKTKDELVAAVIATYDDEMRAMLAMFERRPEPADRLKALAHHWADMGELSARYGCPMGSLCSELDKADGGLDREAARILGVVVDWAEEQFRQMGQREPRELAIALFSSVQGSALLANTFRDPDIVVRQARRLEDWIDSMTLMAVGGDDPAQRAGEFKSPV